MDNKIIEKTREALEEHIQMIIRKGANMSPPDIDFLSKDLCAIETLKRIEGNDGYSEGSYARGRGANGQYVSRDGGSNASGHYRDAGSYRGGGNSGRYYDGDSGNSGYSGHSIQDRMVDQLERMYDEAKTEHEKQTVKEWINRLRT